MLCEMSFHCSQTLVGVGMPKKNIGFYCEQSQISIHSLKPDSFTFGRSALRGASSTGYRSSLTDPTREAVDPEIYSSNSRYKS